MTHDRHLSVAQAREAILAAVRPVDGVETVARAQALGRVLAAGLVSPMDVPPHDNSAMDGYAFDGALLAGALGPLRLRVAGTAYAGAACGAAVPPGHAVRVMTGAVMPPGLDTVVPQELARVLEEGGESFVEWPADAVRPGENRRRAGEDLARGGTAIAGGRVLRPSDLGLAASLGYAAVAVRRRPRVGLVSTGDELREPGQPLPPGCIYDSNRASLAGALQRLGMEVVDFGLVRDEPAALEAAFREAAAQCDAVLTSGGVSVGEADHTRALLARLGEVAFWKVAMRPGRPFAFGSLRRPHGQAPSRLFALPGNPVAALVTFYSFAREALLQLAGATPQPLPVLQARSTSALRKRPGRTEFQRGIVERGPEGWQVRLAGSQGAGILRSMSEANCLVVLGHEQGSVAEGGRVDVWLFDGLV
jgi:molybdopterin molybdotransferase